MWQKLQNVPVPPGYALIARPGQAPVGDDDGDGERRKVPLVHSADRASPPSGEGDARGAELADVISRLRRAMRRAARAADPEVSLSVAQLELLSCLAENPGARPGQLAKLLRIAPSSEATLASGLRRAGLVRRTGGQDDKRTAALWLTPVGETAVSRWQRVNERLLRSALTALAPASRDVVESALPALRDLAGLIDALADAADRHFARENPSG
jgi:DNA-binding MarR family transcriptional regulator